MSQHQNAIVLENQKMQKRKATNTELAHIDNQLIEVDSLIEMVLNLLMMI